MNLVKERGEIIAMLFSLLTVYNSWNMSFYIHKIDWISLYLNLTRKAFSKNYNSNELVGNIFNLNDVKSVN